MNPLPIRDDLNTSKGISTSHSRNQGMIGCAAQYGYEQGYYPHRPKMTKPYWFVAGQVKHSIAQEIVADAQSGKLDLYLPTEELENKLRGWRFRLEAELDPEVAHRWGKSVQQVYWFSEELKARWGTKLYRERVAAKRQEQLQSGYNSFKALYLSLRKPTNFKRTKLEWRFTKEKLKIPNHHDPKQPIWVLGAFDRVDYEDDDNYIDTDLKTGNKAYLKTSQNQQLLMYDYVGRRLHNGQPPKEQYLVALNVEPWAFAKYGDDVLWSPDHRLLANVNFEAEWPEFELLVSDIWFVLSYHLDYPRDNQGYPLKTEWQPKSHFGKIINLGQHIAQRRFVPNIGMHCGLCAARPWCQEDNYEDWKQWTQRQQTGLAQQEILERQGVFADLPMEDLEPEDLQLLLDFKLRPKMYKKPKPGLKLKEFNALGFFKGTQIAALLNRARRTLPLLRDNRECQCQQGGVSFLGLLQIAVQLEQEVQEQRQRWEEQEAKRAWGPKRKKPEFRPKSQAMHKFMCEHCPIDGCRRREEEKERQEVRIA